MTKPYHHGELPKALVDATLRLLETTSADKITVADAARALGVSSGAPFRHFKDRDALMAHVAAVGFDRLRERMNHAFSEHTHGSIDRIVAGGLAYIFFSAEHPSLFELMWGAARQDDETDVARIAGDAAYRTFIDNLQATMVAEGVSERDPRAFGAPLWAMVHGYAHLLIGANRMLDRDPEVLTVQVKAATFAYFTGRRTG